MSVSALASDAPVLECLTLIWQIRSHLRLNVVGGSEVNTLDIFKRSMHVQNPEDFFSNMKTKLTF